MKAVFFYAPLQIRGASILYDYFKSLRKTIEVNKKYFKKTILYTTVGTKIDPSVDADLIIPIFSIHQQLVHYMRVLSWVHYVKSDLFDSDTLLLDADIVINRPFDEIFQQDFALGFTMHSTVNAGVIFLKHAHKERICFHMKQILAVAERYKSVTETRFGFRDEDGVLWNKILSGHWGVDERSLITYLSEQGIDPKDIGSNEVKKITEDFTVFGDYYNLSCKKYMPLEWPSASILHFTGIKKIGLNEYCRKLLELAKPV